jgi:hypothetical protein
MHRTLSAGAAFALLLASIPARAEVGDPTLRTDHPQYAGEGAFQTVEDCVQFATASAASPGMAQEKAIAMYLWLLTHQWHLASPQEFLVPGAEPDTARSDATELMVYDANRGRFSYGYGLCGTVHAWNEPYWKALGMNARRRAFPGHTNSEIEYDGGWHAFDTDMAGLIFRKDGVVAGYADVIADSSLAAHAKPPLPCYPFAWPGDLEVMQRGWREVAKGGSWYSMYHSGYAAHPGVVHLRMGRRLHGTLTGSLWRSHSAPLLAPSGRRAVPRLDVCQSRDATPRWPSKQCARQRELCQRRVCVSPQSCHGVLSRGNRWHVQQCRVSGGQSPIACVR